MGGNDFGSDGMFYLNDAMYLNNTITDLDISNCGYRSTALLGLRTALQNNSTLLKLETHTNRVTKDAAEYAHAEVEANNYVRSIIRNKGNLNAKKFRLSTKNALAMKLQFIPKDILLVLHGNKNLNEPNTLFQDQLYQLCPPARTKLIRKVESADETMHMRIEAALEQDVINHAKIRIYNFIVKNRNRKLFNLRLTQDLIINRKMKASEESAIQKRARELGA